MAGVLQVLINQWPNINPNGEGLTTSELLKSLEERRPDYESIREAVCELCGAAGDKLPSTRSLGNKLKRVRGRVVNGKALDSDDEHGKARWVVRPVKRPTAGCSGGSGCSVPPPAEIGRATLISPDSFDELEEAASRLFP